MNANRPLAPGTAPEMPLKGPALNALKHGLRSRSVLLPGEDVQAFHEMREDMFILFRPRTRHEARCVEIMAGHEWCMERCRRWHQHYHDLQDGLLFGRPDGSASPHCEADPHRWHHKALDCTLEETRLGRLQDRERRKLQEMQKLRRQHLLADAREQMDQLPVLEPEPVPREPEASSSPAEGDSPERPAAGATHSSDAGTREIRKRDEWNRARQTGTPWPMPFVTDVGSGTHPMAQAHTPPGY